MAETRTKPPVVESKAFSVFCTKVGHTLKLDDLANFQLSLSKFGDGEELELYIEAVGEQYTRKQEKFFHGPILKAFESLGYRKQEAKDMLCLRIIPQEVRLIDGTVVRVPGHTSALSKYEYSVLIEESMQCAAEEGLYIKGADEYREEQRALALKQQRRAERKRQKHGQEASA